VEELSRAIKVAELGRQDVDRKEVDTADAFRSASSSLHRRGSSESREQRRSKMSGRGGPGECVDLLVSDPLEAEHAEEED
jgi:hypothetical protein